MGVVSMLALPTMLLRIPTVRGVVRRKTTVVRASVGRMLLLEVVAGATAT